MQAVLVLLVTIEIRQCLIGTLLLLPLLLLIKIIVMRWMGLAANIFFPIVVSLLSAAKV